MYYPPISLHVWWIFPDWNVDLNHVIYYLYFSQNTIEFPPNDMDVCLHSLPPPKQNVLIFFENYLIKQYPQTLQRMKSRYPLCCDRKWRQQIYLVGSKQLVLICKTKVVLNGLYLNNHSTDFEHVRSVGNSNQTAPLYAEQVCMQKCLPMDLEI